MESKICKKCGRELPIEEFYKDNSGMKDGHKNTCKECFNKQCKQYRKKNKEKTYKYQKQYSKTPMGRAVYLVHGYKNEDKKYNRGECTLTAQWVIDNIFTQPCAHCGKTGWDVIGCNRLNNSKSHTPDNVEPCCAECNRKLRGEDMKKGIGVKQGKTVYQYDKITKELVGVWQNASIAAEELGLSAANINKCCHKKVYKSVGGYIWKFSQL